MWINILWCTSVFNYLYIFKLCQQIVGRDLHQSTGWCLLVASGLWNVYFQNPIKYERHISRFILRVRNKKKIMALQQNI